jgi:hypothetical protein
MRRRTVLVRDKMQDGYRYALSRLPDGGSIRNSGRI